MDILGEGMQLKEMKVIGEGYKALQYGFVRKMNMTVRD